MPTTDRYGLPLHASTDNGALFDRGIAALLRFQPEVVAALEQAIAADPGFTLARCARAWLGLMSSEWPDTRDGLALVAGAACRDDRERAHAAAIEAWANGDMHRSGRILDAWLADHPTDALALYVGHQADFFVGDAVNLRDRVLRARPRWDSAHPDFGYLDGMLSFGLEECGDYARAEDIGLRAVEANRNDVWGIHAVVHTYEMQGRYEEGIRYLESRETDWREGNFFNVHNGWHLAVYKLEREDWSGALRLYDEIIHHPESPGIALEMLDASGLLWRLTLDGVDTGGRWNALADAWAAKDPTPWYVFNDLHAIMALVGAGRQDEAARRVGEIEAWLRQADMSLSNSRMVGAAGLAAARGLLAWGRQDWAGAVGELAPVRHHLSVFGGSHAQRDAYQRTLLDAALRAGERALAAQLLSERLASRPDSPWNMKQMSRLRALNG